MTSSELTEWMAYFMLQQAEAEGSQVQSKDDQIARLKAASSG